MKLQAVTICINYGDFLECIAANQRHFDRWVVVTCAEDARTQEICARHRIECLVSTLLQADGKDFHAVHAKWFVLNEGLDALDQEGWAVVLDADVLLPQHFRERLEVLPLEPGVLYSMAGRKVIEDREAFEQARECEPWATLVGRNSQALGYFNLFSLEAKPNRYVRRLPNDYGDHDDFRFTVSFADDRRGILPMTVIHTGSPGVNWERRVTREYAVEKKHPSEKTGLSRWRDFPLADRCSSSAAAIVGYFPSGRWREIAAQFSKVWLVDHFQVHAPCGNPLWEADRTVLRRLIAKEMEGTETIELLGLHSVQNLTKIPDGSLDLLYLPGELAPDWLTTALRHWQSKLRDGAVVCGDLFGIRHWREGTFSVSLMLGAPENVSAEGFWWVRTRMADWKLAPPPDRDADPSVQDGVVLVNRSKDTLEKLLLSLHAARRHWAGPLEVLHWGEEDPSLAIACARLGAELRNIGEEPEQETAEWIEEAAAMLSFRRALLLQPGMLAVGMLDAVFEETGTVISDSGEVPLRIEQNGVKTRLIGVGCAAADAFIGGPADKRILLCAGEPEEWTEEAWECWSQREAEMVIEMVATVRVPNDATIVAIVASQLVADFQRNLMTWRFPEGTPVLVALVGMPVENLWLPGKSDTTRVVSLSRKQADNLPWLLRWIAAEAKTSRVVFLPGHAAALPGADLWCGEQWRTTPAALHWPREAQDEEALTGNRFLPEPFLGLVERQFLKFAADTAGAHELRGLPLLMHEFLHLGAAEVPCIDVRMKGWRLSASHVYVRSHGRGLEGADTRVCIRKDNRGKWLLAEDVVVISLPERVDRREKLSAAMKLAHVQFRIVDGVRVNDEDIDPDEIAEVALHTFKLAGGPAKFLRGTVGCRRAHLQCLEAAYSAGAKSLLLIEDDAQFVEGWLERYAAAIEELPVGWLQLYLSSSDYRRSEPVTKNLHRLTGAYQTTAILYSEAGIEATTKALRRSRCEIDVWMGNHLHPFGACYAIRPGITYQQGGVSDILSYNRGVTP